MTTPRADFDSPWKQALETYFADFLKFFFPEIHADIDWPRGYEFLEQELQQVVRDAELGKRLADKLVKVWRLGGEEAFVLVHIEIQGKQERDFAERMYLYHCRIRDRYNKPVASLAVLTDESFKWRPQPYRSEWWGTRSNFEFPTIKLLDYGQDWTELENSANPFATVVLAHLKALETRKDAPLQKCGSSI
jgi:hypothetical protein